MTTIILTIIGILIAAAGALAVLYYGGFSYEDTQNKAVATTMIGHANMIDAAMTTYQAEYGRNVVVEHQDQALEKLVERGYLGSIPKSPLSNNVSSQWKFDAERGIVRSALGAADDERALAVCQAARERLDMTGDPLSCDDPALLRRDPCCIMPQADL